MNGLFCGCSLCKSQDPSIKTAEHYIRQFQYNTLPLISQGEEINEFLCNFIFPVHGLLYFPIYYMKIAQKKEGQEQKLPPPRLPSKKAVYSLHTAFLEISIRPEKIISLSYPLQLQHPRQKSSLLLQGIPCQIQDLSSEEQKLPHCCSLSELLLLPQEIFHPRQGTEHL